MLELQPPVLWNASKSPAKQRWVFAIRRKNYGSREMPTLRKKHDLKIIWKILLSTFSQESTKVVVLVVWLRFWIIHNLNSLAYFWTAVTEIPCKCYKIPFPLRVLHALAGGGINYSIRWESQKLEKIGKAATSY